MSKVKVVATMEGERHSVSFKCPGCGYTHSIPVAGWAPADSNWCKGVTWAFNGDLDRPTLSPSINSSSGHYADGTPPSECWLCKKYPPEDGKVHPCHRCHFFVTDGQIKFEADSTHSLRGQTVELAEVGQ